jgi:hypothetical protein
MDPATITWLVITGVSAVVGFLTHKWAIPPVGGPSPVPPSPATGPAMPVPVTAPIITLPHLDQFGQNLVGLGLQVVTLLQQAQVQTGHPLIGTAIASLGQMLTVISAQQALQSAATPGPGNTLPGPLTPPGKAG